MAAATTVYLTPQQRKRLFERARKRKTSFSEELRAALDFYLDLPADFNEEALARLAREAKASMERSITRLDDMIARVGQANEKLHQFNRRLDELDERHI